MFNFGTLATEQATSNSKPRLKPWGIYPVKFKGAKKETVQGKKDPTASYDILRVRFEGENGYYEESIFYLKDGDDVRPKFKSADGHEYEGASKYERTMTFIAQVASVLNPDGFKNMQALSSKFKTFDDVVNVFIKITDPVKEKETNLKLVGRNRNGIVEPALPKFVAVSKAGDKFVCDNFIGDKLFFSAYEEARKAEYLSAKPTNMSSIETTPNIDVVSNESDSEVDFESLL